MGRISIYYARIAAVELSCVLAMITTDGCGSTGDHQLEARVGISVWAVGTPSGLPVNSDNAVSVAADGNGNFVAGATRGSVGERVFVLTYIDSAGGVRATHTFGQGGCEVSGRVIGATRQGSVYVGLRPTCTDLPELVPLLGPHDEPQGVYQMSPAGEVIRRISGDWVSAVVLASGAIDVLALAIGNGVELISASEDGRTLPTTTRAWSVEQFMRPTSDGGFVVGAVSPPPGYGPVQHVAKFDMTAAEEWWTELPTAFSPVDVAVLSNGVIAVVGYASQEIAWGSGNVGGLPGTPAVLTVTSDGRPLSSRNLDAGDAYRTNGLLITSAEGNAMGVATYGGCGHIWMYSADLVRMWERPLDNECRAAPDGIAADSNSLVIAGPYSGTVDFGEGRALTSPGSVGVFVVAFAL